MHICLSESVQKKYPDLKFTFFQVPIPRPYPTDEFKIGVEKLVTAKTRDVFLNESNWEDNMRAKNYTEFYSSMGLNGRKCSNPIKQAFRFLAQEYKSKSPIIDKAMEIEYVTSISIQIYDFYSIGPYLRIKFADGPLELVGHNNEVAKCRPSELITLSKYGPVHAPSTGNAARFSVTENTEFALVRLMKPPNLDTALMKDAVALAWKNLNPTSAVHLGEMNLCGDFKFGCC